MNTMPNTLLHHRRKEYHRRGPWACDECRLRKRKCDGTQPCSPCVSTAYVCTYESRGRTLPPTQKVRSLESKLRQARGLLLQLKDEPSKASQSDIDSIIKVLQCEPLLDHDTSTLAQSIPKEWKIHNMMAGGWQLISSPQKSEAFFGPSSGASFVCRTFELFLKDSTSSLSMQEIRSAILNLFDRPLPVTRSLHTSSTGPDELPNKAISLQLLDGLFARCSLVSDFLCKADLIEIVELHSRSTFSLLDIRSTRKLVLLQTVLMLGYLYHVPLHRTQGCRYAQNEAFRWFNAARLALDLSQCNDITSLQSLLCIIMFLISTSRISAAHPYIGVACSSALRLGLDSQASESRCFSEEQRQERKKILITVLKFDAFSSLALGLPSFMEVGWPSQLPVFSKKGLFQGRANDDFNDDSLRIELALQHLHLLKIVVSGLDVVFPQYASSNQVGNVEIPCSISLTDLEEIGDKFHTWAKNFSLVLRHTNDAMEYEVVKYEIEMTYYFGQISLYKPFLHYLKKMADGETVSRGQSQHALACIKIASITISRSQEMAKQGLLCSASWMSVYCIFLSVVCLIFLIAAHNGTSKPSEAWRKAQNGIRLLTAARCRDDGATACLDILKKLISELSHTVDFDLDEIEASTARFCQLNLIGGEQSDKTDTQSRSTMSRSFSREQAQIPSSSTVQFSLSTHGSDSTNEHAAPGSLLVRCRQDVSSGPKNVCGTPYG